MPDVMLIYLSDEKVCATCKKPIAAGNKAIRKHVKETKRRASFIEYYHENCYGGKK